MTADLPFIPADLRAGLVETRRETQLDGTIDVEYFDERSQPFDEPAQVWKRLWDAFSTFRRPEMIMLDFDNDVVCQMCGVAKDREKTVDTAWIEATGILSVVI